ncbi:MAG: ADP-ribosylglycohydrolase family protein, partial [Nanoarchaeota archaeon]
ALVSYFIQEIANGKSPKETLDMIVFEGNILNRALRKKLSHVKQLVESNEEGCAAIREIGDSGFVEDVVYSSVYGTLKGKSFEEAVLISANGSGDTDSRAALTGAFSGLEVGIQKISEYLRNALERGSELERKATRLYHLRK